MRFTKMQGAGNDYVYVDCFHETPPTDPAALARRISDRHFGVGADGLILICPSQRADVRMRMFNADGSEAEMCGNGVRCVAKYAYEHALARKQTMIVETGRGLLELVVHVRDGCVDRVRVDMGAPVFDAARIPTTLPGNPPTEVGLTVQGPGLSERPSHRTPNTEHRTLAVTCLSMGNPHCVVFLDHDPTDDEVLGLGPRIEHAPEFPNRTNVEFVRVLSPAEIRMRVWERGSGETLACGTGACAAAVAAALTRRTGRRVLAQLPGGQLEIDWSQHNHVYLTGPAVEVFTGDWRET